MGTNWKKKAELVVICLCLFLVGVFVLIPAFPPFGILWCGITGKMLSSAIKQAKAQRKETESKPKYRMRAKEDRREQIHSHTPVNYSYDECAMEKRLEQLDVLKGAGLLDDGEYAVRKQEILAMSGPRR